METNKFAQAMEREVAWKTTENGQPALNTTFDKCLDLFGTIGALRSRTEAEIKLKFSEAYREDPLTAVKILFYARDIELGLGERNTFKICLNWLADFATEDVILNLENVVKFGRWDDLYVLDGTRAEKAAYDFMKEQFLKDCLDLKTENKPISLLGKWLKSINTSSEESRALGKKTAKMFGLSEVNYRKCLSALRTRINVIEKLMSQNEWEKINFNHVGGNALKRYKEAFIRHQEERYREYLEAVKENKTIVVDGKEEKAKMNVKKLMPYEIIREYWKKGNLNDSLELMWKNLNDYVQGADCNAIVMADVSGSMACTYGNACSLLPIYTSIGLAIYFAERNTGLWHNMFMTFSSRPTWVKLKDSQTLLEKLTVVRNADWGGSTDLTKALRLILDVAVKNKLEQKDLPKSLIIISDMEFNSATAFAEDRGTFTDLMKAEYAKYGYTLPEIVYWNAAARNDTYHCEYNTQNVRLVSGQAASVFKTLIDGKTHTPQEFMFEVINNARYDCIKISE